MKDLKQDKSYRVNCILFAIYFIFLVGFHFYLDTKPKTYEAIKITTMDRV